MDLVILSTAAFVTSILTAVAGVGGGMFLIGVMSELLPPAALVPVHGLVQLASNSSRVVFDRKHVRWDIVRRFTLGAVIGVAFGAWFVRELPTRGLLFTLGAFILVFTWLPKRALPKNVPGSFPALGLVQGCASLFVGAVGPMTTPFLLREELERDAVVVTHGAIMVVTHLLKVAAFGAIGFAFGDWWVTLLAMAASVTAGSFVGTKLRKKVSERTFKVLMKALLTVLAVRLLWRALGA